MGLLPEGIHACGLDEVKAQFGGFQDSDQRPKLFANLEGLIVELRKSSLIKALVVNGSFVTNKAAPNDVDMLIVLKSGYDWRAHLTPGDYALAQPFPAPLRLRCSGCGRWLAVVLEIRALLQSIAGVATRRQGRVED